MPGCANETGKIFLGHSSLHKYPDCANKHSEMCAVWGSTYCERQQVPCIYGSKGCGSCQRSDWQKLPGRPLVCKRRCYGSVQCQRGAITSCTTFGRSTRRRKTVS